MMPDAANAIKIAVLEEQLSGLREQQKAHNDLTQSRFDKLTQKIDDLTAIMNRGKGAYAASMAFAGAIGAVIMSVIAWAAEVFHGGAK